ncbi:hypothetical protein [Vallitalea sp.]|jgi:hypothetical protein|uniref:hypothetical protein n=1 Tax=Vallitalea sp. TaxID=1882829 RepID=UPI0025EE3ECE|nr:hypothetical protein [Vallitalea sp.]MCT4686772.1 hypothetical protein [Vallitalea sp.]
MDDYENNIATSIYNQTYISDYINSIKQAIIEITREQLVNNLSLTINECKEKSKENNKNSLQLLEAIKPFMDDKAVENIDRLSTVFNDIDALRMLLNNFISNGQKHKEDIIPEDKKKKILDQQGDLIFEDNTVYEIDKECKPTIKSTSTAEGNKSSVVALFLYMLSR